MSFTSESTGGKYKQSILKGSGYSYGLTNSNQGYGGRVPVLASQYNAEVYIPFDTIPPYFSVYFWRRTA